MIEQARAAVGMAVSPHRALSDMYRRSGPVTVLGAGRFALAFFLGPETNQFVLGHSELFRWREAFDSLAVVDGETALILSDGPDQQRRRRLVTPAFTRGQLDGYARFIRASADATIDTWRPGQLVDLYQESRRIIRRATIRVLFGERLAREEATLGDLLQRALDVVERRPPWQQLQRLGAPSWRRAVAARAQVARRVREEIDERRRSSLDEAAGGDVLDRLLASRGDDGQGLSEVEITDQVISLIAAGYETTSAAAGSALLALLSEPNQWERAAGDLARPADWRYLDGVVSETLRLYPPAAVSARKVARPFTFAGVSVPAGATLIFSPYVTHRLPELWPDPLCFRPERWDPSRPDFRRPGPHEFLPFSGGPHRCIGAAFATLELTVLLERLLGRTRLRLRDADPRLVGLAAMRPRRGPSAEVLAVEDVG